MRPHRAAVLAAVAIVLLGPFTTQAVSAGEAAPEEGAVEGVIGVVSDDPAIGIHPAVAALPVASSELDAVSVDLRASLAVQAESTELVTSAVARLEELAADAERLDGEITETEGLRDQEAERVAEARRSLQAVALDAYVQAGGSSRGGGPLDPSTIGDDLERDALASSVRQHHAAELADANEELAAAEAHLADLSEQRTVVEVDTTTTTEARDQAAADLVDAEARIPEERVAVDDAWRTAMVEDTDIPLVAADAYYRAAAALVFEDPSCGLRWEAIAGIGRVEGHHGSFGAAELQTDGTSEPYILGIALDGTRGTRVIVDSDGGALDGDPTIDRAVGPMQFIPTTWTRWATDGNGDGDADPHSLYDAARSAGVYLCQSGPGLDTDEGLLRSFFSYNRSAPYGQRVLSLTHEYDAIGL